MDATLHYWVVDQRLVKELLDYNPKTGDLIWRVRSRVHCSSDAAWKRFNTRYAGRKAFIGVDSRGRCCGTLFGKTYFAHKIIWLWMTGSWPKHKVDHFDRNPGNNRWKNLRDVTSIVNCRNNKRRVDCSTGVTGVYFGRNGKFYAQIGVERKTKNLGTFDTIIQASVAREAAKKLYGFTEGHGT